MTYRFSVPGIAGGSIGLQGAINDASNIPMPLLQAPQKTGLLGINQRLEGLATNPLFNMGIGMLGSQSPHLGGSLADGGRQLQSGVMLKERMKDQSSNREYRNKMLELAKQRANQRKMIQGADGYQYYEDGSRVLPNVNAPQAPQLSNMLDETGKIIGQQDPITGKITPVNLGNTGQRKSSLAPDGIPRYVDTGEPVFPGIEKPVKPPETRTINNPDGTTQDQEFIDNGWKNVGAPKQSPAIVNKYREGKIRLDALKTSINNYKNLLRRYGTEFGGQGSLNLGSAYNDTLMEMKELFKLGVLAGPDMEIMEGTMKDPTTFLNQRFTGNDILQQLDSVVVPKIEAAERSLQENYGPPSTGNVDQVYQLPSENANEVYKSLPSGSKFIGPDGIKREKP